LVASPYLADRNFLRSVVYIVKHDEDGAYGLILNRPTDLTVGQLLKQMQDDELERDSQETTENLEPIYHGGPVEGPIVVVHEHETTSATKCQPGVYLSSEQEDIAAICSQSAGRFRVFSGYAGWAPQQLEEELKQGGWLLWSISKAELFAECDEIWQTALRQIGREILAGSISTGHIPDDPSYN
jgi:putative transcriptional regulator